MTERGCRRQEDGSRSSESIPRTTDWHRSLVSSPAPQRPKLRSDCCQDRPSVAWKAPCSGRSWSVRSKGAVTTELEGGGFPLNRTTEDREELAIDVRLLDAMLRASSDPEVGMGAFTIGVRVVPRAKMPRCPKLHSKEDAGTAGTTGGRRRACCERPVEPTLRFGGPPLADKVRDVLHEQSTAVW